MPKEKETMSDSEATPIYECYFADGLIDLSDEDDGLIWKDILREGEWAYRPGPNQKPVPVPLRVVIGHSSSNEEIGMQDLIDSFEDKAMEHITVPTSHKNEVQENTGFVKALKIEERDGQTYLRAGIEFTEPEIKEKVERRTIANSSAGIVFDYLHKQTGKKYGQVLDHVALTNKPWITGNKPFGMSEDINEEDIVTIVEASEAEAEILDALEVIENNKIDFKDFSTESRKKLASKGYALPDGSYPIVTIQDLKNAIQAFGRAPEEKRAQVKRHIIKRAKALGATSLLPDNWKVNLSENSANSGAEQTHTNKEDNMGSEQKEVETHGETSETSAPEVTLSEEALTQLKTELALADEFEAKLAAKDAELAENRKKVRVMEVDKRVKELEGMGFSEYPGLLSEIRNIMLADSGEKTLTLSETLEGSNDSVEVSLSVSDVVERFIAALPSEDGKLALSEQTSELEDHSRPKNEPEEVDLDERIEKFAEELGIELPKVGDS